MQYDKDCTTWSPQGEISQIKYVLNAVTSGSVIVGLKSKTHSVLAGFKKRQQADFSSYDQKLFNIDDHCGIAIAGMTADARVLAEYMRGECLNYKYNFDAPMQIGRLVAQIGDKSQYKTLIAGKRPYGVGLLVQSWEEKEQKCCIYETSPSGDFYEYIAVAIGARKQSANTYLEKHFETFDNCSLEQLIKHAVKALDVTTETEVEISCGNIDVTIVGAAHPWKKLSAAELQPFVDALKTPAADPMDTEA